MESTVPDDTDNRPSKLTDADRRRAQLGLPIQRRAPRRPFQVAPQPVTTSPVPQAPQAYQTGSGPAGFGSGGESMAGRVPGAQRKPEYAAGLPSPGSVLGVSDTDTTNQYPGSLGFPANKPAGMGRPGSADLLSASFNPGLYAGGGAGVAESTASPDPQPGKRKRRS